MENAGLPLFKIDKEERKFLACRRDSQDQRRVVIMEAEQDDGDPTSLELGRPLKDLDFLSVEPSWQSRRLWR